MSTTRGSETFNFPHSLLSPSLITSCLALPNREGAQFGCPYHLLCQNFCDRVSSRISHWVPDPVSCGSRAFPYVFVAGPNKHDTFLVYSLSRKLQHALYYLLLLRFSVYDSGSLPHLLMLNSHSILCKIQHISPAIYIIFKSLYRLISENFPLLFQAPAMCRLCMTEIIVQTPDAASV